MSDQIADDKSEDGSVYSKFSSSSSDDEDEPRAETHDASSDAEETMRADSTEDVAMPGTSGSATPSLTWEALRDLEFEDDDAADAELERKWRLQQGEKSADDDVAKPKFPLPLRWWGDDIVRNTFRMQCGGRVGTFEQRSRIREEAFKKIGKEPTPLRTVRSADDVSPESPEDPEWWDLVDEISAGPYAEDPFADPADEADDEREFGEESSETTTPATNSLLATMTLPFRPTKARPQLETSTTSRASEDTEVKHAAADVFAQETFASPPASPRPAKAQLHLAIPTSSHASEDTETKHASKEADALTQEDDEDSPKTPPSDEELEFMTQMSPTTSYEKLRELYAHLKSIRFADGQMTLGFKRQLLKFEQKRMKYNGLPSNMDDIVQGANDPELTEMYSQVAAHLYRIQREEYRVKASEEFERSRVLEEQLRQLERLREEDAYTMGMLQHEASLRDGAMEELEETRRRLREKTEEARGWKKAHEMVAPIAAAEYDRKQRRKNGEDGMKDAQTQTEDHSSTTMSAETQTATPSEREASLEAERTELAEENARLNGIIEDLRSDFRDLRSRNDQLEERVETSDQAWEELTGAVVNVEDRKGYLSRLRAENKTLQDDNGRLRKLVMNFRAWHEEQEKKASGSSTEKSPLPPPPTTPATPLPPAFALTMKPEWIERERQIRSTESFKRNRDYFLLELRLEAAKEKEKSARK